MPLPVINGPPVHYYLYLYVFLYLYLYRVTFLPETSASILGTYFKLFIDEAHFAQGQLRHVSEQFSKQLQLPPSGLPISTLASAGNIFVSLQIGTISRWTFAELANKERWKIVMTPHKITVSKYKTSKAAE